MRRLAVGLALIAIGIAAILLQERVPVGELFDRGPVVLTKPLDASQVAALAKDVAGTDVVRARAAAQRLETAGPAGIEALDVLIAALDAKDGVLRLRATKAIGALGRAANRAVPAVARRLLDTNQTQRDVAVDALRFLEPDAEQSRRLCDLAMEKQEQLLWHADKLMVTLHAPTVVPRLLAAARGPDDEAGAKAVHLIGNFEQRAAPACAALVTALRGDRPKTAAAAGYALGHCCRDAASIDALIAGLDATAVDTRRGCIDGLNRIGAAASRGRDALRKLMMSEDDPWDICRASEAYVAVGGDREAAAVMLAGRLRTSGNFHAWLLANELGRLGVAKERVLEALREATGRGDEMMRRTARESLETLTRGRPD